MSEEDLLTKSIRAFAAQQGYFLREDKFPQTVKGLLANKAKYGKFYCPCRRVKLDDPVYCKKIECPCAYADIEVATKGHCLCQLYWAEKEV